MFRDTIAKINGHITIHRRAAAEAVIGWSISQVDLFNITERRKVLSSLKDFDDAVRALKCALECDPKNAPSRRAQRTGHSARCAHEKCPNRNLGSRSCTLRRCNP